MRMFSVEFLLLRPTALHPIADRQAPRVAPDTYVYVVPLWNNTDHLRNRETGPLLMHKMPSLWYSTYHLSYSGSGRLTHQLLTASVNDRSIRLRDDRAQPVYNYKAWTIILDSSISLICCGKALLVCHRDELLCSVIVGRATA